LEASAKHLIVVPAQGATGNSTGMPVACETAAACLRRCALQAGTQRCIKNWIPTRHVVPVQTGAQGYDDELDSRFRGNDSDKIAHVLKKHHPNHDFQLYIPEIFYRPLRTKWPYPKSKPLAFKLK
jgi:hypothetical protein